MKLAPALALLVLPVLLTAAACAEKGETTTTGADSSSSTTAVTEPGTTENPTEPVATVTSATDGETTGCGPNNCGPCDCAPDDVCVDGQWECGCLDCEASSGSTGDTDGSGISCTSEPQVFPSFDRTCAAAEDCSLVFHQLDCCGTLVAWGLNSNDAKPFAEVEAMCQMQFPMCDCSPMPTVTDDGKTVEDAATIMVACMDGSCHSFVP